MPQEIPADILAQQLPKELQEEIYEFAEDAFKQWNENASPVSKAIGSSEMDRCIRDSDFIQAQERFMIQAFDAADKNQNTVLNEEEFTEFIQALMADGAKRGNYEDRRTGTITWQFMLANRINKYRQGVSVQDWQVMCHAIMTKT